MSCRHWSTFESDADAMYAEMALIRRFEEAVLELRQQGLVRGPVHVSIGQEAVAVGGCWSLTDSDVVVSTHRGHHHCVAKGADLTRLIAELLGRQEGFARGRGGSMHLADPSIGLLGTNGIVGGGLPIAAGAAYAKLVEGSRHVVVCFFGEGAAANGVFGEVMNIAGLWKLPLVLVCENNRWVEFAPERVHVAGTISRRGEGYDVPGLSVDGNDVEAVATTIRRAVESARSGNGATLVEALTYRWHGHHAEDPAAYREADELAFWKEQRDPLGLALDRIGATRAAELDALVSKQVGSAVAAALAGTPTDADTLWADQAAVA